MLVDRGGERKMRGVAKSVWATVLVAAVLANGCGGGGETSGRVSRQVDKAIDQLKDSDPKVRLKAAQTLSLYVVPQAVEPLIEVLKNDVRAAAAEALGPARDKRAFEPLIAALKDEEPDVRRFAAGSLALIGDERAVEPLTQVSQNDANEDVRTAASLALGELKQRREQE
jgi:HEAT repeat protein